MIGTWKLNPAKSKYTPGPAPKSQTATIEAAGDGIKNVTKGIAGDTRVVYSKDGKLRTSANNLL